MKQSERIVFMPGAMACAALLALAVLAQFGTGCGVARVDCSSDDPGCNPELFLLQFLNEPPTKTNVFPTHLYATDGAGNFYTYSVNRTTGSLTQLGSIATGATQGYDVVLTPDQNYVYAGTAFGGATGMYGYSLSDPDNPTALSGSPFDPGVNQRFSTITPDGRFIYSAPGTNFNAYSVDSGTGNLSLVTGSPFGSTCVGAIVVDSESKFFYNNHSLSANGLEHYSIDASTGALTQLSAQAMGFIITQFAPSRTANRIYGAANDGGGWKVYTFTADSSSGLPSLTNATPIAATTDSLNDIMSMPDESYVIASENFRNSLQSLSVESTTGNTTLNADVLEPTDLTGSVLATSPANDFVWASNNVSEIITYEINPDGSLTRVSSVGGAGVVRDMKVRSQTETVIK